jgi:hypothetical protein
MTEGATAGIEALLALNPIQRAQQKNKVPAHQKKNVILNGLQTARQEQYLWLEISCLPFCAVFRGLGADSIPLSKRRGTRNSAYPR